MGLFGVNRISSTVLTKALIEEAVRNGIPVVVIDLKGDLASLGIIPLAMKPDELARFTVLEGDDARTALARAVQLQKESERDLGQFGLNQTDAKAYRERIDFKLITPGANYGVPVSLANQLAPPDNADVLRKNDPDLYREICTAVTETFLSRLFPTAKRESYRNERAFLHTLVRHCWDHNEDLKGLSGLQVLRDYAMEPPFDDIAGTRVADLLRHGRATRVRDKITTMMSPPDDRWFAGNPLDVRMLVEPRNGRTPLSVISVPPTDPFEDRAFVVSQVSYILTSWMLTLAESEKPRVLLVIDEIGAQGGETSLFPSYPSNPPSKRFLNQIVRQGRSFGVCAILATQNPSDIDYKALSNCGLWLVGKLNTTRDRANVLQGMALDDLRRPIVEGWISGADTGEFVFRDIKEETPVSVQVRHLYSYHRGLDRKKLEDLARLWS